MVPERIRNVVLVGHGGSGKTSLAEALLFAAGSTTRVGRVEDGNTVMDHEPEEVERGISLSLGVASVPWKDHKINLLDTPGYADFVGEARAALRAADLALFVVSAVDGVEVQTEILWRAAGDEGIPRAVFVNKLDRERANFARTLDELREAFGKRIAPVQVPVGAETSLEGITRVVSNRTYRYNEGDPHGAPSDDGNGELAAEVRQALVEAVVETDDAMLEAYFDGEEPEPDQIVTAVHNGMLEGEIFPVLCGSATQLVGIDALADFITDFGPRPLEHAAPPLQSGELGVLGNDGPVIAYVFKTLSDPYVGRISFFRVFTGTLRLDDELEVAGRGVRGRMHNLFFMQGKEHNEAREVAAGDIAAIAKFEAAHAGDTLRTAGTDVVIVPVAYPAPVMAVAVNPHTAQDEEKLSTALQRILEEDPTLQVERRPETRETLLTGLGDSHLEVTLARIARKFGVGVDTATPKVPYREAITRPAQAEGKHKKQTGGRGQFGVAFVKFEPRERGNGYEFVDDVKGGSIPRQFIPAVDRGIKEALERGILAGYPVTDVRAAVFDGKYHSVDSDELSFRMAGIQAVRTAAPDLGAVLLEPIMRLRISVPEEHMGDVMGDINARRGKVLGMDSDGTMRIVTAEVPMGEVQRYAIDLRSMTHGRGVFEIDFDHYAEMPGNEAQKVIAASQAARQDGER